MTFQPGANLYTQGFGSKPENVEVPHLDVRDPSSTDINFPVGKIWINTVLQTMFFLPRLTTSLGVLSANWTKLEDASGALNTLSNGTTKVTPDVTGNISITGTGSEISVTSNPGSNNLSLAFPSSMITPGSLEVTGSFQCDSGATIRGGNVFINHDLTFQTFIGHDTGGVIQIDADPSNHIDIGLSSPTININGTVNINTIGSEITSIGGTTIDITSTAGAELAMDAAGNLSFNPKNGNTAAIAFSATSGNLLLGNTNIDILLIDAQSIAINNATGNGNVQIGNVTGSGGTFIDSGSAGVKILNTAGNNANFTVGPTLPNGTAGNIILNTGDIAGTIQMNGGQTVLVHPLVSTDTTVTVAHYFIPCDSTLAVLTVFLPGAPRTGQHMVVSDVTGAAATNSITISGNGQLINGMASQDITVSYGRADLYYTGTEWSLGR